MSEELDRPETREDGHVPGEHDEVVVVGIGASAGGIRALRDFFAAVPADTGLAYVVILHLSPDHDSKLAEVLQAVAAIPVTQVQGAVKIAPDHVYVIPPNQSLSMYDGALALSDVQGFEERRAPVDIFFRTLAESRGDRAVSVVLSGTGANGSMGLKRVKERGGVAFVQDPNEAEYADMPRNSIATGLVDFVLPVADIPARIVAYAENRGDVGVATDAADDELTNEQALREVFTHLRARTGHDFAHYKRGTVLRRIERRINVRELSDLQAYARFVATHPDEADALLKDLLISVTNFFRDPAAFAALAENVIPRLFDGKGPGDQVRVWVAGCATGEEAYSLAMLLAEHAATLIDGPDVQVFATDIDERAIAAARDGFYTPNDAADVSPERLRRFFVKEAGGYRVRRELRETVLFANHNLIKDPPFSHLDLISCRNLLIYLGRGAQERVMDVLHFALRPGGYLFLGASETVTGAGDLFSTVDKDHHIFQCRAVGTRHTLSFTGHSPASRLAERARTASGDDLGGQDRLTALEMHRRMLEHYGPPSALVDEEYRIVHLSERAGRYLHHPAGEPSLNLLELVRPELRLDLMTALHQAVQKRATVEARGLRVRVDDRSHTVTVVVRPSLRDDDPMRGLLLVLFEETFDAPDGVAPDAPTPVDAAAGHLEEELARVRAHLRATVEQYELQHEELRASNEELQAINEELRSTAEELETSKEELQSVNEELTTVNQELKVKIDELGNANSDFRNLINSTDIGTIFLDRGLRIKLSTPRARDLFNLIPSDAGRPLDDITNRLVTDDLAGTVERVMQTLHSVEREVATRDGHRFVMRIFPYRTLEDHIDGVVITFVDITERKRAEDRWQASEERLRLLVESASDFAIFTITHDGLIDSWSAGAERVFGYAEGEIVGQGADVLFTPEDRASGVPAAEMTTAAEEGHAADERWHMRKGGERFYASGVMRPLLGDPARGFVKIARDLTEQQQEQERLQRAHDALEIRVGERTSELNAANDALRSEVSERGLAEAEARTLLRRVVTVQEDERRRISRDLHDQLGQQLTALRLKLELVRERAGDDADLAREVESAQALAESLDADVDYLAWEMRPSALDELGLVAALGNYVREWSAHFGVAAELHAAGPAFERLTPDVAIHVYRIAQEALNNVAKHAGASQVNVIFEVRAREVTLIVEDDGRGFDPDAVSAEGAPRLGLGGMRERARLVGGTLEIESAPGRGTTVFARIPLASIGEEGDAR
jgi:two-component system CheB/CheR fusion protein